MKAHLASWLAVIALALAGESAWAEPKLGMELNKLESRDSSCRAYLVFDNGLEQAYTKLKLDLILFDREGVITKRVALDAAPVKAQKMVVKVFDISDVQCGAIGRILINEVLACATQQGEAQDCLTRIEPRSRASAELVK